EIAHQFLDFKTWMEEVLALFEAEEAQAAEPLPTYTPEEESEELAVTVCPDIMKSLAQLAFLSVPTSDIPVAVQFPRAVGRLSQDRLDDFAFDFCMGRMMVYNLLTNNTQWVPQEQCEDCSHEYDEYEPPQVNYCKYHLIQDFLINHEVWRMQWGRVHERDIHICIMYEMDRFDQSLAWSVDGGGE
ncbi:hypothetical protein HK104_008018, partial [Borealophlyctis nickersoniae]